MSVKLPGSGGLGFRGLQKYAGVELFDGICESLDGGLEEDFAFLGVGLSGVAEGAMFRDLVEVEDEAGNTGGWFEAVIAEFVLVDEVGVEMEHEAGFRLAGVADGFGGAGEGLGEEISGNELEVSGVTEGEIGVFGFDIAEGEGVEVGIAAVTVDDVEAVEAVVGEAADRLG